MTAHLNTQHLKWLREIAIADIEVENRIPPVILGVLLKFGLVETHNMLTLKITRKGRKRLAAISPEFGENDSSRAVRYALFAAPKNTGNMPLEQR